MLKFQKNKPFGDILYFNTYWIKKLIDFVAKFEELNSNSLVLCQTIIINVLKIYLMRTN